MGEADGDFRLAAELIDQVILRHVSSYIDETNLNDHRRYVGMNDTENYVTWHRLEMSRGKDYRKAVRGFFDGELPNNEIYTRAYRVVVSFLALGSDVPFIVIVKDTDNKPDVKKALDDLRAEPPLSAVVIGCVHTEQECWLLAAFEPDNDAESDRLQKCRAEVGFNPCLCSEQLTATKKDDEKLSPKRVYKYLNDGDHQRSFRGLHRDYHARLKARGQANGLAAFLDDVEQRLLSTIYSVRVISSSS